MKAAEDNLRGLLQGGKQYSIPMFQRPYSWNVDNWEVLWDDILNLYENADEENEDYTHFLGPIVTVAEVGTPDGVSPYVVIDGQQRLATLSILLASLRDHMKEEESLKKYVDELHNLYIINQYKEGPKLFKVIPTKADRDTYQQIIAGKIKDEDLKKNLLYEGYVFFREQLKKELDINGAKKIDTVKLQRVILERLDVVHITLDKSDNPYIIFESLNYKGTPLTQADLVRNYFFMNLPSEKHDEIYEDVWYPIQKHYEKISGNAYLKELTDSFWYYLRKDESKKVGDGKSRYGSWNQKQIYQGIKNRFDRPGTDMEASLRDLLRFSEYYSRFRYPNEEPELNLRDWFHRFKRLDFTTSYPLLLNLYDNYMQDQISAEEFERTMGVVESYFVRRLFVGRPTNALNKVFNNIYHQIGADAFCEKSLTETLRSYSGNRTWPIDEDFREGIIKMPVYYPTRSDRVKLILESLEAILTKERVDPGNLTIEHIMPRTLTNDWKVIIGPDAEEQHSIWCDVLGNLTLTAYNSELSNKSFADKKQKLLSVSSLSLNKYFKDIDVWDTDAIKQRGYLLADLAIKIWPR